MTCHPLGFRMSRRKFKENEIDGVVFFDDGSETSTGKRCSCYQCTANRSRSRSPSIPARIKCFFRTLCFGNSKPHWCDGRSWDGPYWGLTRRKVRISLFLLGHRLVKQLPRGVIMTPLNFAKVKAAETVGLMFSFRHISFLLNSSD